MNEVSTAAASVPSSGGATTAPTSFNDVSWSDAPSASAPSSTEPGSVSPASATTAPDPNLSPDGLPQQPGEPPRERWEPILANARTKAVHDFLQEQGLVGFTSAQLKAVAPWLQKASTDPAGFLVNELATHPDPIQVLQQAIARLQADPTHGATLRSLAGKALQQLRGGNTSQAPPMVRVQLEDGSVVNMPRDPGAWLAFHQQQWLAQMKNEFAPVTQTVEQLRAQQQAVEREMQIDHFVTTTHQDVVTWPGMADKANQEAVAARLAESAIDPNDPREVTIALNRAYREVVLPTLSSKAESAMLDKLKTNAAASTGINPGSSAPSAPRTVTKFTDLGPEAWR